MIVKELELKNFRSHAHTLVRFPPGRTLLEGDIGSGKSSVLMAIEFALFGLGTDSGSSVLRLGTGEGEVRMVFEVDGADYQVKRALQRRSGRVQQSEGELKTPTETLSLSPSELKERVLEVLGFNEAPDPKAQSWIFRYAVYTPQEEMKSILSLAPEQRLQILRRAFRVEDYKTAADNSEEAARAIRLEAARQNALSEGSEDLRMQLHDLGKEEERCATALDGLEAACSRAEAEVKAAKSALDDAMMKMQAAQAVRAEREHYERQRDDAARDAADAKAEAERIQKRLAEVEAALKRSGALKAPTTIPLPELRRKERALDAKVKKLTTLLGAADSKLLDYRSIMEKGVCPVCERPVEAHDFEEKTLAKKSEREHVAEELGETESELDELRRKIDELAEYQDAKREAASKRTEASRLREDLHDRLVTIQKLEKRVSSAEESLRLLADRPLEPDDAAIKKEKAERRLREAELDLRRAAEELATTREKLSAARKRQEEIAAQIVAKEEAATKGRRLLEREMWLEDYFVPTVRAIEKSVLATINQEFDGLFKKWFAMLVGDTDKEVRVDEDFTPLVTQGGYEQDVRYLSGGERTSIAMAYRLALNVLARKASIGMRSSLLILDEPTDGFSKEQLGSVREVLDEVGSPQVIIVSHDKELESFADQIYRVSKVGDRSTVFT